MSQQALIFIPTLTADLAALPSQLSPYAFQVFVYRQQAAGREYLLLHRADFQEHESPGGWQGIDGILEPSESWHSAVQREVFEKSGLTVTTVNKPELISRYAIRDEWRSIYGHEPKYVEERVFASELHGDSLLKPAKGYDAFGWFTYAKAYERLAVEKHKQHLKLVARNKNHLS